jgi:membrane-bound ClpP family serine protease
MNAITLLFTAGIILLAFEVFVPGAILGIIGAIALFAGVVVAFVTYGVGGGLAAAAIAVALIGLMLFIEFVVLPRTAFGRRMFLEAAITAHSQEAPEEAGLLGRAGRALTPLVPSGFVEVDGRRYDAFSRSGPLAAGDPLRVVAVESFRVIVTKS